MAAVVVNVAAAAAAAEEEEPPPPSMGFTGTTSPRCAALKELRMSAEENFLTSFL